MITDWATMTNLAKLGMLLQPELCASSTVNLSQLGLGCLLIEGLAAKPNKGGLCLREQIAGTNLALAMSLARIEPGYFCSTWFGVDNLEG